MPKVRKVARRKKYRHVVNRKKLNKKMKKLPTIPCEIVKEAWDDQRSVNVNLNKMGLSSDPNTTFSIPRAKETLAQARQFKRVKKAVKKVEKPTVDPEFPKLEVAEQLERQSKERKRKTLQLSTMQVDKLAYYIEKYGQDYQEMTKDRMNYDQNTWKQIRAQIKKFMECKEQWDEYWKSREVEAPVRTIVKGGDDSD